MKQGCGKGKGRLRPSSPVLRDEALALLLLQAHQVMLGRWSLSPCFSEYCLRVPSHLHTHKHPLNIPDWMSWRGHVPQDNWDDPPSLLAM